MDDFCDYRQGEPSAVSARKVALRARTQVLIFFFPRCSNVPYSPLLPPLFPPTLRDEIYFYFFTCFFLADAFLFKPVMMLTRRTTTPLKLAKLSHRILRSSQADVQEVKRCDGKWKCDSGSEASLMHRKCDRDRKWYLLRKETTKDSDMGRRSWTVT